MSLLSELNSIADTVGIRMETGVFSDKPPDEYADDGAAEVVKEFQSGTLSLGIADIGTEIAEDLTGATIDGNKVLISTSEDGGDPVLRTAVIFFYLSNEGISLLENSAHLGLPIPEKLKDVLAQLHNKKEDK